MRAWLHRSRVLLPWVLIGGTATILTLGAMLPAAWLAPQLTRATHGYVNLVAPEGSLWQGSATLLLAAGADQSASTLLPGRLNWHMRFWPLFLGRMEIRLQHTQAMPEPVTFIATTRSARLSAGSMTVPTALLTGLGAPFNTLDLQGNARLDWSDWRAFEQVVYGQLTITVTDLTSRISQIKPLGTYRAVLQAQGSQSTLALTTVKGPLMLTGQGVFEGGAISFRGNASAAPDQQASLAGLLNLLGRPAGDGSAILAYGASRY